MNDILTIAKEKYIQLYKKNFEFLNNGVSEEIIKARENAFFKFLANGLPSRKEENYRYTDITNIFSKEYELNLKSSSFNVDIQALFKCDVPELDTHILLTINGYYHKNNKIDGLPKDAIICSLREASTHYNDIFNKYFDKISKDQNDNFIQLNTCFAQDGTFIYIPDNTNMDKPIQIVNIAYSLYDLNIFRRNLIIVGENSHINLIVCDHTLIRSSFFTNVVTEVFLNKNATIKYSRLQNENNNSSQVSSLLIKQEEKSNANINIFSLHGGFVRNNFIANLDGEFSNINLNGLYIGDYNQHVSNFTLINHNVPNCKSNQLFKSILFNQSTSAFNGKIFVAKDSQKTEAYQKNSNILLSPQAKAYSKPHLEIYADDVKCSHGSTTGRLDDEALFYMRSRGINFEEAKHLLMFAYGDEIIENIYPENLRTRIQELFEKRLRGELSKCDDCAIHCA